MCFGGRGNEARPRGSGSTHLLAVAAAAAAFPCASSTRDAVFRWLWPPRSRGAGFQCRGGGADTAAKRRFRTRVAGPRVHTACSTKCVAGDDLGVRS